MTSTDRHAEIRAELADLYVASAAAATEAEVRRIEARISYLECEASTILTPAAAW